MASNKTSLSLPSSTKNSGLLAEIFGSKVIETAGFVALYCKAMGISRTTFFRHRKEMPQYEVAVLELLKQIDRDDWPDRWQPLNKLTRQ